MISTAIRPHRKIQRRRESTRRKKANRLSGSEPVASPAMRWFQGAKSRTGRHRPRDEDGRMAREAGGNGAGMEALNTLNTL